MFSLVPKRTLQGLHGQLIVVELFLKENSPLDLVELKYSNSFFVHTFLDCIFDRQNTLRCPRLRRSINPHLSCSSLQINCTLWTLFQITHHRSQPFGTKTTE